MVCVGECGGGSWGEWGVMRMAGKWGIRVYKVWREELCSAQCFKNVGVTREYVWVFYTAVPSSKGMLNLLHMDLCGLMRVASINGKKYILVIVDDFSRYTWTLFLSSKDETTEVLKEFLTMIQRNVQPPVITVRTDRGIEFLNKKLNAFFKEEGIEHQTSTARTPKQNGVVERRNRTLVEAARTMLSALQLPLFFWAEAIATVCYTQYRSIIIPTHDKTPYHIINDWKSSIKHLNIFGCICYITRDGENLKKIKEKGDQCILVGYSTQSKGYRVCNKRTRMRVESIHIHFDEIKEVSETSVANNTSCLVPQRQKASDYDNPNPVPQRQDVSSSADADAKYTLEILHKHGMDKGQSIGTPMATKPKLDADLSGNPVDQTDYHSKIGSLMYLTYSRPNIVQAICFCARYQSRPTEKHLKEVKRIFRYLRGTVNMRLWYPKGSRFELTAFSYADHAGLEAEYVALFASCAQVMWMRTQLQDYGFNYNKIPLYCDSQAEYQLADMFTKALPEDRFKYLVRRIGMRCLTPVELEVLAKESA
nr:retrovirus-related Pol polyprotein from transposon TNT 1-94 [Tanacetum cinerariifolium]